MTTTLSVFDELRKIIYEQSGIKIQDGKETMISARLASRLRFLELSDVRAYVDYLKLNMDSEIVEFLDVISTNVTSFFREAEHFDVMAEFMRKWLEGGQKRFRFWSAASSTGQEPYSLAMTLMEALPKQNHSVDIRILGTDISTRVLARASKGAYAKSNVEEVPVDLRKKYFDKDESGESAAYQVTQEIRDLVSFSRLNLSSPPFPMSGPFDAIFVRNVMIYFDDRVRDALVKDCHRLLRPGGLLFVGKSEGLHNTSQMFDRAGPSIYKKIG